MRLDKFLSDCGRTSRRDAAKAISRGQVTLNGTVIRDRSANIDPEADAVCFCGERVIYRKYTYIMMNKPEGVVSATEDKGRTVLDLLPEEIDKRGLFPCGRLDKYTVGLMLITDDGERAHFLLSPKRHVSKTYNFKTQVPLSDEDISALEAGVDIGGYVTKPCRVEMTGETEGKITISEGKYHQIKLMMEARKNKITFLERVAFGSLTLDGTLPRGGWRMLTDEEIASLYKDAQGRGSAPSAQ